MKKLKNFSVTNMSALSREEMALINGGEFIPFECTSEGQACAVDVSGGVLKGMCKWYYASETVKYLYCYCESL